MQSRYYNSEWGRFISADVYCDTGDGILGTNMYAYCQNDPVNAVDPSGSIIQLIGRSASQKILFDSLQGLTDDILKYGKDGIVSISTKAENGLRPLGTNLVRDAIAHKSKIMITKANYSNLVRLGTSARDIPLMEGMNPLIIMDYQEIKGMNTEFPGMTNSIALGHELIHVMHLVSGNEISFSKTFYKGLDNIMHYAKFEEVLTVGLLGRAENPFFSMIIAPMAKYTENGLRAENWLPLRKYY